MSALRDLERQLHRSVDAGAAGAASPERKAPRRRRLRGPRLFVALVLTVGAATGAVAATGLLRVEPERPEPFLPFAPDSGQGVRSSAVRMLPLRVTDPQGGPPWVLRTFTTTRGASCLQAGQLYRGRFGRIERDETGQRVFRLVGIHLGATARCTNRKVGGLPVFNGLREVELDGGPSSPERCGPRGGRRGACPVRAVTIVRFGMLGPNARRVAWIAPHGFGGGAEQRIAPGTGGAYLMARRADPAPWRAFDELDRRLHDEADRRYPVDPGRAGLSRAERRAADQQARRRIRFILRGYRNTRAARRAMFMRLGGRSESIEAAFTDGRRMLVAGRGATGRPLPGVAVVKVRLPRDVRRPLAIRGLGASDPARISFEAPVTIDRMGWWYRVTVRGPSQACGDHDVSREVMIDRTTRAGARLSVSVPAQQGSPAGRWCAGRRYTVRVRLMISGSPTREREVGRGAFVPRASP